MYKAECVNINKTHFLDETSTRNIEVKTDFIATGLWILSTSVTIIEEWIKIPSVDLSIIPGKRYGICLKRNMSRQLHERDVIGRITSEQWTGGLDTLYTVLCIVSQLVGLVVHRKWSEANRHSFFSFYFLTSDRQQAQRNKQHPPFFLCLDSALPAQ